MNQERIETLGPLRCIVIDGSASSEANPDIAVVICHGYGASFRDLPFLAAEWCRALGETAKRFRFVFPDAPESLDAIGMPGGRAWWPINMMQLTELVQASQFDQLHDKRPPGIDAACEALSTTIGAVLDSLSSDQPRLVIGGFSQGAMLTMETSTAGEIPKPDAAFLFSGTLVCKTQWKAKLAERLGDARVYQSHGEVDPILPFSSAEALRDLIASEKIDLQFHSFYGPHTIDGDSIVHTARLLSELAERSGA